MDILIVEDNDDFRLLLVESLEQFAGRRPRAAANGQEAMAMIEESVPDLIISDTNMPKMNGIELLQAVRARHPEPMFILLFGGLESGNVSVADIQKMGASMVVGKEFVNRDFFTTIAELTSGLKRT